MYNPVLLLLSSYLVYVNCSPPKCCPGKNILHGNNTCSDGSKLAINTCHTLTLIGPSLESQTFFNVDPDDTLIVTTDQNLEYLKINPDKYCLTNNSADNTEIAVVCSENKENFSLSTKGIVLMSIKAICSIISVLFLLVVLIIYLFLPDLRDIEGNCVVNFIFCLCITHLAVTFIPLAKYFVPRACNTMSFIYFIAHVTSYNWLSVLSFHLWRITIRPVFRPHIRWFLFYCCYGYGLPIIILTTSLTLYYTHDIKLRQTSDFQCWVDGSAVVWGYFYGTAMLLSLLSIIFQFLVAKKLWMGDGKKDQTPPTIRLRNKSLVYLHLLLIMALVKILEVITYVYMEKHKYLDYVWQFCDCRNLLLGGVIFFILIIQRTKVLKALSKRGLLCIKLPETWKRLVDEEAEKRQSQSITEISIPNSCL